jgi:hypothetical protein
MRNDDFKETKRKRVHLKKVKCLYIALSVIVIVIGIMFSLRVARNILCKVQMSE